VSAIPGERVWPLAFLFEGVICECLATGVLAVPDGCRLALCEANHVVFPVEFN
jgi:hypothetical protein